MSALRHIIARFCRDERGASLVEFALVVMLFFFLFFVLIDFGRLGSSYVMAEKAAQLAVRTAVTRPPVCSGVPERHARGTLTTQRFGTSCRFATGVCVDPGPSVCTGADGGLSAAGQATANEVWARIRPLLPPDATLGHVEFRYEFDSNLGFLGGPYTPMVTVTIRPPDFQFVAPLGAMALALGTAAGPADEVAYRGFSVSMPGEDLAHGEGG